MQTEESVIIVDRFFLVLDTLIENHTIRGRQTFCDRYGINRRNLWQLDKKRTKNIFQSCWLTYLVRDFNVSAVWLLTGQGSMFN